MSDTALICPFCGKKVEIHVHPEWDDKRGVVYGALISHGMGGTEQCVDGMEVGLYSVHYKQTEKEAYDCLAKAFRTRKPMERIVEQLEYEKHITPYINGRYSGLQKAIEIVKRGGQHIDWSKENE